MDQKFIIHSDCNEHYEIDKRGLGAFIFDACSRYGDQTFQVQGNDGKSETYATFKERCVRLALALKNLGLTKNNIIGVCTYNTIDTLVPVVASLFIGATVTSFDPVASKDEQAYLINLAKPKIIFTQQINFKNIQECLRTNNLDSEIVVMEDDVFKNMLEEKHEENNFYPIIVDGHETAFIFYSSGSTGLPKGICVSHYALLYSSVNQLNNGYSKQYGFLSIDNVHWAVEIELVLMTIKCGSYRVIVDEYSTNAKDFIEPIEKYKVTYALLSPSATNIFKTLNLDKYDLKKFETLVISGSKVTKDKLVELKKLFPYTNIIHSYGSSELLHVSQFHVKRDAELLLKKPDSVGKLSDGISAKIVDLQTNLALGPNAKGELCVKSPCVMNGYYQNNENILDEFGYFKTGDVAYYDEEQCFYIVSRIKDVFKFKAMSIYPFFLEQCLMKHKAVKECVVFGVPHEFGEIPSALVVLQDGASVTEKDLLQFANNQLNGKDKLDGLRFIGELPKTCTHKIVRSKARRMFLNLINNHNQSA